jgi:hypothetical protein
VRSHNHEEDLEQTVQRNNAIAKQTWAKDVDHIVFHEDDFKHQAYLEEKSDIKLTFISVQAAFDFGARAGKHA